MMSFTASNVQKARSRRERLSLTVKKGELLASWDQGRQDHDHQVMVGLSSDTGQVLWRAWTRAGSRLKAKGIMGYSGRAVLSTRCRGSVLWFIAHVRGPAPCALRVPRSWRRRSSERPLSEVVSPLHGMRRSCP